MSEALIVAKLVANDTFSDPLEVDDNVGFAVCVEGEFTGDITLQIATRWRDIEGGWIDIEVYGQPTLDMSWRNKGRIIVRAGFKDGDYASGEARVQLYRGEDDQTYVPVTKKVTK